MTKWYWQQVGGTLLEEFPVVLRTPTSAQRLIDGVILPRGDFRIARPHEVQIEGQDVIVVQTKGRRLGMTLMGQTFFSAQLMLRFRPRSITGVALCLNDDEHLRPVFESYPNMKVVVCPPTIFKATTIRNGPQEHEMERD